MKATLQPTNTPFANKTPTIFRSKSEYARCLELQRLNI